MHACMYVCIYVHTLCTSLSIVEGIGESPKKIELALVTFSEALGALVSLNKSFPFCVGDVDPPFMESTSIISVDTSNFPSLIHRMYNRYCSISRKSSGPSLLLSLRKKLLLRSSAKLSFIVWIVVANQVLLPTTKSCILKIWRLICNFLWSGKTEGNALFEVKLKTGLEKQLMHI